MTIENPTPQRRPYAWVSGANILLGAWILISPFALAIHHFAPALWNNTVVGILVGLFALIRVSSLYDHPWWSFCNTLLGIWLGISPFLLGFAHWRSAMLSNVIGGAVIAVLALTSILASKREYSATTEAHSG
jgi:hypothetical protein